MEQCLKCERRFYSEHFFEFICPECVLENKADALAEVAVEMAVKVEKDKMKAMLVKDFWLQPPAVQKFLRETVFKDSEAITLPG